MAPISLELKAGLLKLSAEAARSENWQATNIYRYARNFLEGKGMETASPEEILRRIFQNYTASAAYRGNSAQDQIAMDSILELVRSVAADHRIDPTVRLPLPGKISQR